MANVPVSIHPYFKVKAGRMEAALALLPRFIERTRGEEGVLWYEFTREGETIFCREGYKDAAAARQHLESVEELLAEMLRHSDLERLEFHGPEEEIAKLREALSDLPATFYTVLTRLEK